MNDFDAPAVLPPPRGEWSQQVMATALGGRSGSSHLALPDDPLYDDDLQLGLYLCYELSYRGLEGVPDEMEWDPALLSLRRTMETAFENALLDAVPPATVHPDQVGQQLRYLDEPTSPFSRFIEREATLDQVREFVIHRSAYHLKEADPHTFALPRIGGAAKAAFAEIQADEYGGGKPDRIHAHLFASMMSDLGLVTCNGAYLDVIPGSTLAPVNLMSLFGMHRRWRGAAAGHLALFELGSSRPNRFYGDGLRRLGFGPKTTDFHDEHVEADAIHSMIATYDLAARLAEDEPELVSDILFGAKALLHVEEVAHHHMLGAWNRGASSLLGAPALVA